jgi:hypothetical protein
MGLVVVQVRSNKLASLWFANKNDCNMAALERERLLTHFLTSLQVKVHV